MSHICQLRYVIVLYWSLPIHNMLWKIWLFVKLYFTQLKMTWSNLAYATQQCTNLLYIFFRFWKKKFAILTYTLKNVSKTVFTSDLINIYILKHFWVIRHVEMKWIKVASKKNQPWCIFYWHSCRILVLEGASLRTCLARGVFS